MSDSHSNNWPAFVRANLRLLRVRPEREAEIVEDLARQLDDAYRETLAAGATESEARRAAETHIADWHALANELSAAEQRPVPRTAEWHQRAEDRDLRNRGRFSLLTELRQDLLFGLRMLRRAPGVTAIALLSLAIGIGANTSIFSVVNAVLLKAAAVSHPEQLMVLSDPELEGGWVGGTDGQRDMFTWHEFEGMRDNNTVFSGIFAQNSFLTRVQLRASTSGESASFAMASMVSGGYWSTLGVTPLFGQTFGPEVDHGIAAHPVAVISYAFWLRHFQADPNVLGKTIPTPQAILTVVGVMPASFTGITVGESPDFWTPLTMQPRIMPSIDAITYTPGSLIKVMFLHVVTRRKPGVTFAQAAASIKVTFQHVIRDEAGAISSEAKKRELASQFIVPRDGTRGLSSLSGDYRLPLTVLMALVGMLLLLATANIANLLLARAAARRREMTVRLALGAGRARLVRQLLTESLLLAGIGGLLGLLLSFWGDRLLLRMVSQSAPPLSLDVHPDMTVLLFLLSVSVATALLIGLAPAFGATRMNLSDTLRGSARSVSGDSGAHRISLGRILVAAQVAISLVLLVAAGLFVRTLQNLSNLNFGYDANHLLLFSSNTTTAGYSQPAAKARVEELAEKFTALPGVSGASFSDNGLFNQFDSNDPVVIVGRPPKSESDMDVKRDSIGPSYFAAVGIPVLMGRDVTAQDTIGQAFCWINETMAKFYFGNEDPLGHHIQIVVRETHPEFEVAGVVADAKYNTLREQPQRRIYTPYLRSEMSVGPPAATFEVRYTGDAAAIVSELRQTIREADPALVPSVVNTIPQLAGAQMTRDRATTQLAAFFGLVALGLACIGLYGVLAHNVARRTSEIGLRMALGATRGSILAMILRDALLVTLLGAAAGVVCALFAARAVESLIFGITPRDPVTIAVSAAVLLGVAVLAAVLPARRASRVDPLIALRYE